jgi:transposase
MAEANRVSLAAEPPPPHDELELLRSKLDAALSALEAVASERDRIASERDALSKLLAARLLELDRLRRQLYAQKAEKVDPGQLELAFAEYSKLLEQLGTLAGLEPSADETPSGGAGDGDEGRPARKPKGRRNLEESSLPTEDVVIPVEHVPEGAVPIEPEISYRLEYVPGGYKRLRLLKERFVVPQTPEAAAESGSPTTILTADAPLTMIAKGLLGPGLLAHIFTSKFADKLPYHRLEEILARDGIDLDRSTMCRAQTACHELAQRVVRAMREEAIATAHVLATDATGVLVQDEGACRRGHFWVAIADHDHVFFHYSPRHTSATPQQLFAGFQGYLQADASSVYDALFRRDDGPEEVGCWAHARRHFYWALRSARPDALVALGFLGRLFELDRKLAKLPPGRRAAERKARSGALLRELFAWRDAQLQRADLDARSPFARALRYLARHEQALSRFVDDPKLPLDNNRSERELRQLVIGRKNWLFVGHDQGAESACTFISLIASCRLHGLDPESYLRDLFRVLPHWPAPRVLELAPKHWARTRTRLRPEELQLPLGRLTLPPPFPPPE